MPKKRRGEQSPVVVSPADGDYDRRIYERLGVVASALQRAYPERQDRWYDRVYTAFQTVAKYVGIPALLIAAVSPVVSAFESYREHRNKKYVTETYTRYAEDLLARGAVDRARAILLDLENAEKRDVRTQYMVAKVATMDAIKRGKNHQEAEDRANILLRLHRNRGVMFPAFGGAEEITELEFAIADIHLQLGRYDEATALLEKIEGPSGSAAQARAALLAKANEGDRSLLTANVALRRGTLAVLRYEYDRAVTILPAAIRVFRERGRDDLTADATFQLAKAYQFAYKPTEAIREYEQARKLYAARNDDYGLLRVYNNLGMIHQNDRDLAQAGYYYGLAEKIARQLGDQLGIARAVSNLSIIEKDRGNYQAALKKGLEAQEAFRLVDNKLGLAAAHQGLANLYQLTGDLATAIHNGEQAAAIFRDLGELRGLSDAYSVLSQMVEQLGDAESDIYYSGFAFILRRHIGKPESEFNALALRRLHRKLGAERFNELWEEASDRITSTLREMNQLEVVVTLPEELQEM